MMMAWLLVRLGCLHARATKSMHARTHARTARTTTLVLTHALKGSVLVPPTNGHVYASSSCCYTHTHTHTHTRTHTHTHIACVSSSCCSMRFLELMYSLASDSFKRAWAVRGAHLRRPSGMEYIFMYAYVCACACVCVYVMFIYNMI